MAIAFSNNYLKKLETSRDITFQQQSDIVNKTHNVPFQGLPKVVSLY
jgi:hypothetical protein